jgi:hypothetical protein
MYSNTCAEQHLLEKKIFVVAEMFCFREFEFIASYALGRTRTVVVMRNNIFCSARGLSEEVSL